MSLHDSGEDALIEQPTIRLFQELGWETANCFDEVTGPGSFLGRETRTEVVLVSHSRRIPTIPDDGISPGRYGKLCGMP